MLNFINKINNKDIKIVFMGTPEFSVPILTSLATNFNLKGVICPPDKPVGRKQEITPCAVKTTALNLSLKIFQPKSLKNNEEIIKELINLNPDIIVVAAYGKILPREILNLPKHGCLNVHTSLLPKYRGASPIQTAIHNGDKKTGISIILMDEGLDTGDILSQKETEIAQKDNAETLHNKLSLIASKLIIEIIPKYISGNLKLKTQNDDEASYCYQIKKSYGKIRWHHSAVNIFNQIRAYTPWPGVYTIYKKRKLEIIKAEPYLEFINTTEQNGTIIKKDNKILVKCGSNFLELLEIKLEGKKQTIIKDFLNGHQDFIGSVLE